MMMLRGALLLAAAAADAFSASAKEVPGGGTCKSLVTVDDFETVADAFSFANANVQHVRRIAFSARTYLLSNGTQQGGPAAAHMLQLAGSRDLVIDGAGAQITVTDPAVGFLQLRFCSNVTVVGLSLDYSPKPNSQGMITAVDSTSASVLVAFEPESAGNPSVSSPHFRDAPIKWALIKDPLFPRRQKPGLPNTLNVQSYRLVSGELFNLTLPRYAFANWATEYGHIEVGDPLVFVARYNSASAFSIYSSSAVHMKHIRILSAPAASYVALNCSGLVFTAIVTAPAIGRWHSTGADGIYTVGTRALSPGTPSIVVQDSKLESIGDDGIILKTMGLKVVGTPYRRVTPQNCVLFYTTHTF